MNAKIIALGVVLLGFVDLTAWAIYQHGYLGFFELANANAATRLLALDLVICLALILVWMRGDARQRGEAFAPFALLTLGFGAAGPLLYLIRREWREVRRTRSVAGPAAATAR